MKKTALTLLLAATLGVSALAAPTISVDQGTYEFGAVLEGTIISHKFVLTNVGDQMLEIAKVRASCGCTTMGLPDSSLSPGESVELEARVDTTGFGGTITKAIYIDSNDPNTPSLTVYITGNVTRAQPYHITVGDLDYLFYLLIDLRAPEAYAEGHLMGAVNIPHEEFGDWIERLPSGVIIILYDQDGTWSDIDVQSLQSAGFAEARSLLGGLDAWSKAYGDKFIFAP